MTQKYEIIWKKCLQIIKDNIPAESYNTWFRPIVPLNLENYVLTIQVPSAFFYEFLEEHYLDLLKKTLRVVLGHEARLEYKIIVDNSNYTNTAKKKSYKIPGKTNSMPTNKPMAMEGQQIKNPFVIPGIKKVQIDPQLNSSKSFENFIEGECNRLGRSAGLTIAKNPGTTSFNPLMLHSQPGLGKTHLAQAIGIRIKEQYPDKVVLYVSANRFQTQFTDAVRKNNINNFTHFYQMIDVLILDDVQEFIGKTGTQKTFFHIFNQLHQAGKQLILTADRPPVDLDGLNERLLSRFKWGLTAELQMPDFETRLEILRKKAYNDGIELHESVLKYIATNVTSSIRELEGALISLLAQSTLNNQEITLKLAQKILSNIIKKKQKDISISYIQKVVCDYFKIEPKVLKAKTRKREIVQARQIAMYFSKNYTNSSLSTIGSEIGGKDHSTVLHSYRTVRNLLETDSNFKNFVDDIERQLKY